MATNLNSGEDIGIFSATRYEYELTNTVVRYWDFAATAGLTVGHVLRLIAQHGRQRYRMTGTGVGCRHWV